MADIPRSILVSRGPRRVAPQQAFFATNLLTTTLAPAGAVQAPFRQLNWPNPIRQNVTLARHFLEAVSYYTPPPIFPIDYQNPVRKRKVQQPDLVPNLVLNALYTPPPVPFIRFDWQNPVIKRKVQAPYQYQNLSQVTLAPPPPAPTLLGQIPNLSAAFDSGTHTVQLGDYAANFTSVSISPAIEAGWTFNTTTGELVYDTDDEDTFGPYIVTFTNANGDTASNAFLVTIADIEFRSGGWVGIRLGIRI